MYENSCVYYKMAKLNTKKRKNFKSLTHEKSLVKLGPKRDIRIKKNTGN